MGEKILLFSYSGLGDIVLPPGTSLNLFIFLGIGFFFYHDEPYDLLGEKQTT